MDNSNLTKVVLSQPVHLLDFGFGSGLSPKAPGTVGTIAAVPFYLLMSQLSLPLYLVAVIASFAVGIYLCEATSKALGVHDHGGKVWDEFVGFWMTMIVAPAGLIWVLMGFIFFRIFDILKPFPIAYFDKHIKGGFGIMIDDALAAAYAWLCLQASYLIALELGWF